MSTTIRTNHTTAQFDDFGILHVRHDDGAMIELDDAEAIVAKWEEVHGGRRHPHLIDFRKVRVAQDPEARSFFAKNESIRQLVSATAILVDDMASNMVAKFYVQFNKPPVPTKVFKDKDEAVTWLRGFIDHN